MSAEMYEESECWCEEYPCENPECDCEVHHL